MAAAVALLVAAVLVFLGPALATGRWQVAADVAEQYAPWRASHPDDWKPRNASLGDSATMMFPWYTLAAERWRAGTVPRWNPYAGCGAPLLGNYESGVFYPLHVWVPLLGAGPAMVWVAASKLLVAALGAFALALSLGCTVLAAAIGGLAFALSGALVMWLGHPISGVVCWLPVLLALTVRLMAGASRWDAALLGGAVCAQFLAGHPETSVHVMAFATAFALWRACLMDAGRARRLSAFVACCTLGFALSAIQTLPVLEYLGACSKTSAGLSLVGAPRLALPAKDDLVRLGIRLPLAICPDLYGSPTSPCGTDGVLDPGRSYNALHAGTVAAGAMVLAALALIGRARDPRVRFFAVFAAITYLVGQQISPLPQLYGALPLVGAGDPVRILPVTALCLAMLAALGADHLDRDALAARPRRALALTLVAAVAVCPLIFALRPLLVSHGASVTTARFEASDPETRRQFPIVRRLESVERRADNLLRGAAHGAGWVGLAALGALIATSTARFRPAGCALVALSVLAPPVATWGTFQPPTAPDAVFPPRPALAGLAAGPHDRFSGTRGAVPPNTATYLRLRDLRNYDGMEVRTVRELVTALAGLDARFDLHAVSNLGAPPPRLMEIARVQRVVTPAGHEVPGLTRIHAGPDAWVHTAPQPYPRAYVADRFVVEPDPARRLALLASATFDASRTVVLEEPLTGFAPTSDTSPAGAARFVDDGPERVVMRVETRRPALVVLADTHFPGWSASVDGAPAPLLRANHAFRAVVVPAGTHEVVMDYRPDSLSIGAAITLVAAALLAATVFRRRRRA